MFKFIILGISIFFMLNSAVTAQDRFAKYPKIVGYEVRPGILTIPRYTAGNELCEIGVEKLLYSPSMVRVNADLDSKEIYDVLDELVPTTERGAASKDPFSNGLNINGGAVQHQEFENVWLYIYGDASHDVKKTKKFTITQVVATVKWKNRTCSQANPPTPPSAANSKVN